MKFILSLTLLGLVLSACQTQQTDAGLRSKVADLEYRINLLEKQLANQEATRTTGLQEPKTGNQDSRSYGSSSPDIKYNGSSRSTYSPRCQAITKKGTQCKRTASAGGYCWQHRR